MPYALISDYEKSFGGRFKGQYSKVEVVTLQPTLSYQINDRVSVGFGPTINKIKGKLVNKLDNSAAFGTGETKVGIKGDDVAYGFNVGLMVDVTDSLTWGLTYHSKVDYTLEGRTKVSNFNQWPANAAGASFAVQPASGEGVALGELERKTYEGYLTQHLQAQGLVPAAVPARARMQADMAVNVKRELRQFSVPVYRQVVERSHQALLNSGVVIAEYVGEYRDDVPYSSNGQYRVVLKKDGRVVVASFRNGAFYW